MSVDIRSLPAVLGTVFAVSCTGATDSVVESGRADGPASAQVFRTGAGVANKPLVRRATGTAIADELVVTLAPGALPAAIDDLAADVGAEVVFRAPRTGAYVLRLYDGAAARRAFEQLSGHGDIAEVAFNRVMGGSSTSGSGIGTSPGIVKGMQWNFPALQLDPFSGFGLGDGVRVAVLDSGAAYEVYADDLGAYTVAPDLAGVAFAQGYDFINGDEHPNDDHGHGTHVAGVIAASGGVTALAPGVEILPVKVLDADNLGTELALAEGIYYAVDSGADVINMSLSFSPTYFPSRYLQSAVDYASAHGVVMVAAVGNHDEEVVTYPAAFRDVIAVGATSIHPWFYPLGGKVDDAPEDANRWAWVYWFLERAPYSNRGYAVDVAAPAGRIDLDADGDDNPEAILAQTFQGDPLKLDYYLFAGTSQAAAQVTGVAAVMLRENPDLTPYDLRAVLGETAGPTAWELVSPSMGRGKVRAERAAEVAATPAATAPRLQFYAAIHLAVEKVSDTSRRAVARVEVVDASGAPVPWVRVFGSFTGAAFERGARWTNGDGVATFRSSAYGQDGKVVAFQVDAIGAYTWPATVDHPRGFLRTDTVSLELLSQFGNELEPVILGGGPGEDTGGSGIGTSPGDSVPSVMDVIPIVIAYSLPASDPAYTPPEQAVSTLVLSNFSWGQATVPMAVVVEESWFLDLFPEAAARRIVAFGSGIGTSPLTLDPIQSFPIEQTLDYDEAPPRINVLLTTFTIGSGIGTSPGFQAVFPDVFYGIGTDTPVAGVDAVLADFWTYHYAAVTGAGIGTSPGYTEDLGLSEVEFDQIGNAIGSYVVFGLGDVAAPVGAYGNVLDAAGVLLAPVDPVADGGGIGTSPIDVGDDDG